tara:strand:+ start:13998 stop:14114 length:117 start_codon:yes stop_codon:yes gene_type:complete
MRTKIGRRQLRDGEFLDLELAAHPANLLYEAEIPGMMS